jgi:carboxyl-terminal processing protease
LQWVMVTIIFLGAQGLWAQTKDPNKDLRLSCEHLSYIQESYVKNHISVSAVDKNLEKRIHKQMVKLLDGSKIYFYQSDIAKFKKEFSGVFKQLKLRKCGALQNFKNVYFKRVKERVEFAKAYLGKKFKFNKKTELILSSDDREYPKNKKAAQEFQKKYVQYQVSSYLSIDKSLKESKELVSRSYDRLERRIREMSNEDLYSYYINAFAHSLDPHTSYFSRDALEDFKISMSLSLEGIGATLSSRDGFTVIEQLMPGGAAGRSGELKPKDKIVAVGQGKKGAFENVIEMDLRDVVRKIRGKKGTLVRLTILRKQSKKTKRFVVNLIRDKIKLEDEAAVIDYVPKTINGVKKKIGLITLPSFYADGKGLRSAAKDMKKLLKQARKEKVDGIVLDLSRNGGGSLDDAVKIAGLFFKTGNVVKQSQKFLFKREITLADEDKEVDWSGPLVILVSRVSASASEIVSGTLKDYKRAIVVGGDHTFGKGTVQSVNYFPEGLGAIKTTVGMFFTAGGFSTQHRGVSADIVFPSAFSNEDIGEKTLDFSLPPKKLKSFLSSDAYVAVGDKGYWEQVTPKLIKSLKQQSQKRISTSKDFQKIVKEIKKSKKRGKTISVAEVLDPPEEDKGKTKEEKAKDRDKILSKAEKKKKYLERADIQESLNIMVDYITKTKKQKLSSN